VSTVEVVVPAYNEAGRIGPTVGPLLDRFDVLVVDDGSTDDTAIEAGGVSDRPVVVAAAEDARGPAERRGAKLDPPLDGRMSGQKAAAVDERLELVEAAVVPPVVGQEAVGSVEAGGRQPRIRDLLGERRRRRHADVRPPLEHRAGAVNGGKGEGRPVALCHRVLEVDPAGSEVVEHRRDAVVARQRVPAQGVDGDEDDVVNRGRHLPSLRPLVGWAAETTKRKISSPSTARIVHTVPHWIRDTETSGCTGPPETKQTVLRAVARGSRRLDGSFGGRLSSGRGRSSGRL